MKKATYLDKDEMELARSLENEEWVSDLTNKEKKQYEEYARYSLNELPRRKQRGIQIPGFRLPPE